MRIWFSLKLLVMGIVALPGNAQQAVMAPSTAFDDTPPPVLSEEFSEFEVPSSGAIAVSVLPASARRNVDGDLHAYLASDFAGRAICVFVMAAKSRYRAWLDLKVRQDWTGGWVRIGYQSGHLPPDGNIRDMDKEDIYPVVRTESCNSISSHRWIFAPAVWGNLDVPDHPMQLLIVADADYVDLWQDGSPRRCLRPGASDLPYTFECPVSAQVSGRLELQMFMDGKLDRVRFIDIRQ